MNVFNKQLLYNHYKSILEQNIETILAGGVGDEFLVSPNTDTRMSIALLIRIDETVSNNINLYLSEIKKVEPELYYYPKEDFHITVLDILKGLPGRAIPQNIEDYILCIKECVNQIKPFHIKFEGMTASDKAGLICGYYEYEFEKLREILRTSFAENGLSLEERYKSFSSHITVTRIPNKLSHPNEFIKKIQLPNDFGMMQVNSLELVYHNWYDSKKQVLAKFEL